METTASLADSPASCLEAQTAGIRRRIERRLSALVPERSHSGKALHEAMRYSLLGGGKRIRPLVTVLAAAHLGGRESLALDPACAVEMVHTASLILDDLPLMDDATLRRGKPTNHRAFGQDNALLAAVGLLNQAYAVIGRAPGLNATLRLELIDVLSEAIGDEGMIAGQAGDLTAHRESQDVASLQEINHQKTAALFVAGAEMGARIAGVATEEIAAVRSFARDVGLAFQIMDDLLDQSATELDVGKDTGQDCDRQTVVSLMGHHRALEMAEALLASAVQALAPLSPASDPLVELAFCLCPTAPVQTGQGAGTAAREA